MSLPGGVSSDFSDQVVIVTGGSSGIGFAIVEQFAARRAHVVIGDLNAPRALPARCAFVQTDVTNWQSQLDLFNTVLQIHGKIDIVCANAGIGGRDEFEDAVDDAGVPLEPKWTAVKVNLIGAANTAKLAIHHFKKGGNGGRIIFTTSYAGYDPFGAPTYAASKHGVVGLMRGLRDLVPRLNISVNCIAPSLTESSIFGENNIFQHFSEAGMKVQSAEDVAMAALYFASNPSVNGNALAVVGGKYFELEHKRVSVTGSAQSTSTEANGKQKLLLEKYFGVPL